MRLDHVTIAGSNLTRLQQGFAALGLDPAYGGPHSNGVTHMAALGFRDGSYIELISTLGQGGASRFWPEFIAADAGPCAWCVAVEDIQAESARLAALGIPVEGPLPLQRQRPDGATVAWQLSFLGTGSPGALLPFLIQDLTPRPLRIQPSASLRESALSGIDFVLLSVRDLVAAIALFRKAWDWPPPFVQNDPFLQARVALFSGVPVVLAQVLAGSGRQRTQQWGDLPAAILLHSNDFEASCQALSARTVSHWQAGPVRWRIGWFSPPSLPHVQLAVTESVAGEPILGERPAPPSVE